MVVNIVKLTVIRPMIAERERAGSSTVERRGLRRSE